MAMLNKQRLFHGSEHNMDENRGYPHDLGNIHIDKDVMDA